MADHGPRPRSRLAWISITGAMITPLSVAADRHSSPSGSWLLRPRLSGACETARLMSGDRLTRILIGVVIELATILAVTKIAEWRLMSAANDEHILFVLSVAMLGRRWSGSSSKHGG